MKVHERIKLLRQLKKWSQEQVAYELGMSANGYGCLERGETNIKLSRLEQLATIFEVDIAELLGIGSEYSYQSNGDNNTNYQNTFNNTEITEMQLKNELEKHKILLTERDKEIQHLKEIIYLLKEKFS